MRGALRSTQEHSRSTQTHLLAHSRSTQVHSEAQSKAINGMIEAFTSLPPLTKCRI